MHKGGKDMKLNERELATITAVLSEELKKPYSELNCTFGSLTIQEMSELYGKLKYRDYCEKYNITYEEMNEFDFEQAYREEWEF